MSRKQKFVMWVYFMAMSRDINGETNEAQLLASFAERIAEEKIPVNEMNAAKVYLSYTGGRSEPFKWMHFLEENAHDNN